MGVKSKNIIEIGPGELAYAELAVSSHLIAVRNVDCLRRDPKKQHFIYMHTYILCPPQAVIIISFCTCAMLGNCQWVPDCASAGRYGGF